MRDCMEKLSSKKFNKKFLCAAIILFCTVISGVFNPLYRIFASDPFTYELEPTLKMIEPIIHIGTAICSICFFIPAWNAVKSSYKNQDDERFKSCMKSIVAFAIVWSVIGTYAGSIMIVLTFFFLVDFATLAMFSIYLICFVNAVLALIALETIKKELNEK